MEKNKIDFIIGLLNNPTITSEQRERVNALLVKELSAESVTEERVKEMIESLQEDKSNERTINVQGNATINDIHDNREVNTK